VFFIHVEAGLELFSKPLTKFIRAVMKKLEPVEVVVPKKVARKVGESFYFRNKPLEEIMRSQSLERTLEVIEFSGGLRFMVQGRKVFVLRIVR
jgi:hypothetical protein